MGAVVDSLARLDAGVSWTSVGAAADDRPGWVHAADLLAGPGGFPRWQRSVAAAYGGADTGLLVAQGLVLDGYLAALTLPAVGVFHLDRRVLDIGPGALLLRLRPGSPTVEATAVTSPRFACLADDLAAGEPDATVVAEDVLAGLLRREIVAHAERLVAAYAPTTRIGTHGLWAAVTDALDVSFLTGSWVSGEADRAAADARLALADSPGDPTPLVGGSTLHQIVDGRGRTHWTRRRYGCCLVYRAPGAGECVTCPRVGDEERRRQAAHW